MVRGGDWSRQVLSPVRTKTIGVVGLGRIGRSMASRCRALGMNVIVFEKYPDEAFVAEHDIQLVDFPELLAKLYKFCVDVHLIIWNIKDYIIVFTFQISYADYIQILVACAPKASEGGFSG